MKILALGDPHGILPKNLNSIIKKNKIDVIVCVVIFMRLEVRQKLGKRKCIIWDAREIIRF